MQKKILWLIGASSGIGLALAEQSLAIGHRVIVSARSATSSDALALLKEKYKNELHLVDMDVSVSQSVKESTKKAWEIYEGIDIVFYNAGVYESMSVEEWKEEHFEAMTQVNYLGAVRVLMRIVPLFTAQKHGQIALNASISSYFGLPYGGAYSAPKAALLNLCESLYPELKSKNIDLQIINHGFVKSRLTEKNDFEMPQLLEPQEAALRIYEGLTHPQKFEIRFPWGLTRFLSLLRMLPYSIAFALTKKALK